MTTLNLNTNGYSLAALQAGYGLDAINHSHDDRNSINDPQHELQEEAHAPLVESHGSVSASTRTPPLSDSSKDWQDYINRFVEYYPPGSTKDTAQWARIKQDDKGGDSTSESMGYAMRMAAQNGDQKDFDLFMKFVYKSPNLDANGLMNWHVNDNSVVESGAATDADQDIAYSLCIASELQQSGQWQDTGNDYAGKAKSMIQSIFAHEVNLNDPNCPVEPGDQWQGRFNSSYVDPRAYAEFAKFDPANADGWNSLATKAIQRVYDLSNPTTGLVPNWNDDSHYGYDACRTPMRLAEYYQYLHGLSNPSADQQQQMTQIQTILNREFKFFADPSNRDSNSKGIRDGYNLDGTPSTGGGYSNPAFNAPVWAALSIMDQCNAIDPAIHDQAIDLKNTLGTLLQSQIPDNINNQGNYFSSSLGVLCEGIVAQKPGAFAEI